MQRSLAFVVLIWASPHASGQAPVLVEQFQGGKLHGWKIEGEGAVQEDAITLGGKAATTLRLTAPLGDRFTLKLEYKFSGKAMPVLQWETSMPALCQLQGLPGQWTEFTMGGGYSSWGSHVPWKYEHRTIENTSGGSSSGSGGLSGGSGPVHELFIVVPPDTTLAIRRISLVTTPLPDPPGPMWVPIATLVAFLLGIVALGWYLNRRRQQASSP